MPYTLVLLRHGQSTWNEQNLFTGWVDVPVSALGLAQARHAGELIKRSARLPDVVHTSLLRRAIATADAALDAADRHWVPVRRTWRLNERHYGALQGLDKAATAARVGEAQVRVWRRSYAAVPPPLGEAERAAQDADPRYAGVETPGAESLEIVVRRMLPYWTEGIVPDLRAGRTVLVAAHGNSLRGLIKELDGLSDEEVVGLDLPTGVPILYELGEDMKPLRKGGRRLDETEG
ncbi:uncharacterized protein E0L32_002220 [Thyridium curvatum]|uniref:Phosphoglycerate mutase n=1 Tax=Thyridium curvatum TaxID=1093900 RepID=A0A507AKZ3_9PEZI|nr:uncharacterized protein E0L32_002220 [Thyridium curvatum]TPX06724.1 hypothetical protein E0L32_002220 [Thyridium curvatum]